MFNHKAAQMKNIGIILWCILNLIGCNNKRYTSQLEQAEGWMINAPDSAMLLLQSIRLYDISNAAERAKYALLYSQALDKNYIDTDNDSLIRIAVNYYQIHRLSEERMRAYYYFGRVQANGKNYSNAIISFLKAEKDAVELKDYMCLGLIYRGISEVYNVIHNLEELKYIQKSFEFFKQADAERHANYALMGVGIAYNNQRDYKKSAAVYEEVLKIARKDSDTTLWANCLFYYADLCIRTDKPDKGKGMLLYAQNKLNVSLSSQDFSCLAYTYAIENKADSAAHLIRKAKAMVSDKASQVSLAFTEYQMYKHQHDYQKALACHEYIVQAQDSIVRLVLDQSVVTAQRDYFQEQSELEQYKSKSQREFLVMTIIISLLIVGFGVLYFYKRLQYKNLEISKYMSQTSDIQNALQDRNVEISEMSQLVQQLFKEKFEFIDQLGTTYYERINTPAEQEVIYNEVKKAIYNLGTDNQTKIALEQIVNSCKSNIMHKLRSQLPLLKQSDYQLLCYLYAGFSYRAISIFTQDKIENIYNRKSRLRTRIANSDADDKDYFLDNMH